MTIYAIPNSHFPPDETVLADATEVVTVISAARAALGIPAP